MRESVQKKYERAQAEKRSHHQRVFLYTFLISAIIFSMVWLGLSNIAMDKTVARIKTDDATRDADFKEKLAELKAARALREKTENQAVQKLVYARMAAGDMVPPKLTTLQCNYLRIHDNPARPDSMVNKSHCIKPLSFEPQLVTVDGISIAQPAADNYRKLTEAAHKAGYSLSVTSSYRSYADQAATYIYWETTEGREEADRHSAYAGYSEHQTGYAVDFMSDGCGLDCFGHTDVYAWLLKHAHEYGFIERYPKGMEATTGYAYEPWHWRYIGVKEANLYHSAQAKSLEDFWQTA